MSPEDLAQVLSELPNFDDPNLLVGAQTADDAAVYKLSDQLAIVQTVDFFTPVVDDPYLFGSIAAANALSDLYAMGAHPLMALNIVGFPRKSEELPLSVLKEILRGGSDKAAEAGIPIVGGHSIDDPEPKYGLCATGTVQPGSHWTNQGASPGDRLILTKPIGVGVITTAIRAGVCDPVVEQAAVDSMKTLNRKAAEAGRKVGVQAATDITGFGLLGHLKEMLKPGLQASIGFSKIPVFDGVMALMGEDCIPSGTRRNHAAIASQLRLDPDVSAVEAILLCDAQTSGGLLFAVGPDKAHSLIEALTQQGQTAADIGIFESGESTLIQVSS